MRRSPAFPLAFTAVLALVAPGAALATSLPADGTVPSADGVPIRYHMEGAAESKGPVLVFVHCWSCDRHLWDEPVAHFAKRYRVVTLDLAGHGESGQGRKDWTIPAFGQDVASVVRALDLKEVILVGHSMGGPVILEAARALPGRVVGLVPVDTLLKVAEVNDPKEIETFLAPFRADYKMAVAKFLRAAMFVPTTDPKLIEKIVAETQARPPEIAIAALAHAFAYDARPALAEIKVPIHAINGDKYPTDVEGNRRYAAQYKVTLMKGVGHYLMLEDPARFDGLLEEVITAAQPFDFPAAAAGDPAALSKAMPGLAREVIAVYREDDRDGDRRKDLDNLFRLQIVAGQYADASRTLASLRALPAGDVSPQAGATRVLYEIFAQAKARESEDGSPFDAAFQRSFRETLGRLDDRTAALVMRALGVDLSAVQQTLSDALAPQKGQSTIPFAGALPLIRAYQASQVFQSVAPLAASLIAEDDQRRYVIDQDIRIRTPDGATVCALVVRPRSISGRLPALLNFTIYANPGTMMDEARRTASHGYAGVEGLTRGKGCSPDEPIPYEHDGSDADAVIDWISRQDWSDGRVGMYGGSYEGFTQWAAAKHLPKALKALMPSVTAAPGIDVPMEGNVFQTFVYYWPFYTTANKTLDDGPYNDRGRWWRMSREWYVTGQAYRALDKIEGTPNPFFDRWLDHPGYDAYWQSMIPYRKEFARIDVPVLTTTGYYDDGQIGALYYFTQHHRYRPGAEHYLLIGPYDHIRGQRGTVSRLGNPLTVLRGYETDPVAQIDLGELRYQWFDFIFKGGPKPAILKDKVNYEVMGANEWKHVPTLAAMASRTLRFHLSAARAGDTYRLSARKPAAGAFIPQTVDLADRTDADRIVPGGGIVDKELDRQDGIVFLSDPFRKPVELSGLFSGRLDFIANKKDLDFILELYELTAKGEHVELSFCMGRASYLRDRGHRQLLTRGKRQRLDFKSGRLTSRRFQPGSRLVAVLKIVKSPGAQINYGTGKDVSDETIADAKKPLKIQWFGDSFIDVPIGR